MNGKESSGSGSYGQCHIVSPCERGHKMHKIPYLWALFVNSSPLATCKDTYFTLTH